MAKYTHKGSQIAVEGSIKNESWEDEQGNKRYRTYVLARRIMFLDNKRSEEPLPQEPDYVSNRAEEKEIDPFEAMGQAVEINDNDLPF
jgi:single-strand DNA-binding protein